MSPALITTSWDDGHPLDERLAERLQSARISGTFYVPTLCDRPVVDGPTLRRLHALGFEIGGHTHNHPTLKGMPDAVALAEMADNKRHLEDILGLPVTSFCYPRGKFDRRLKELARQAGFLRARTTMGLRHDLGSGPFALPVTVQCYPHGWAVHARHAVKEGNTTGLATWLSQGMPVSAPTILARSLAKVAHQGGVVHLWGHSWELEECGLWPLFDQCLVVLAQRPANIKTATNAQAYPGYTGPG